MPNYYMAASRVYKVSILLCCILPCFPANTSLSRSRGNLNTRARSLATKTKVAMIESTRGILALDSEKRMAIVKD